MVNLLQGEELGNAIQAFEFVPDRAQQRVKAKIMGILADNPIYAMSEITYDIAYQLSQDRRLRKWWDIPGFSQWMQNKSEFKQRLEDLVQLSLDTAEDIISNEAMPPAARVNMIKLVWEAAAKFPQKVANPNKDSQAAQHMSQEQLDEMMRKAGYVRISEAQKPLQLSEEKGVIDVRPSDEETGEV
jgi:hypothetical protein